MVNCSLFLRRNGGERWTLLRTVYIKNCAKDLQLLFSCNVSVSSPQYWSCKWCKFQNTPKDLLCIHGEINTLMCLSWLYYDIMVSLSLNKEWPAKIFFSVFYLWTLRFLFNRSRMWVPSCYNYVKFWWY